jgi:hypothetical protein
LIFTNVAKISQDKFFWFQKFQSPEFLVKVMS